MIEYSGVSRTENFIESLPSIDNKSGSSLENISVTSKAIGKCNPTLSFDLKNNTKEEIRMANTLKSIGNSQSLKGFSSRLIGNSSVQVKEVRVNDLVEVVEQSLQCLQEDRLVALQILLDNELPKFQQQFDRVVELWSCLKPDLLVQLKKLQLDQLKNIEKVLEKVSITCNELHVNLPSYTAKLIEKGSFFQLSQKIKQALSLVMEAKKLVGDCQRAITGFYAFKDRELKNWDESKNSLSKKVQLNILDLTQKVDGLTKCVRLLTRT